MFKSNYFVCSLLTCKGELSSLVFCHRNIFFEIVAVKEICFLLATRVIRKRMNGVGVGLSVIEGLNNAFSNIVGWIGSTKIYDQENI